MSRKKLDSINRIGEKEEYKHEDNTWWFSDDINDWIKSKRKRQTDEGHEKDRRKKYERKQLANAVAQDVEKFGPNRKTPLTR